MRTLGQKRAEFALEKVLEIPQSLKKDFKSFSAGAPSMILQNGFGQALAFWVSKGNAKHTKHIILFGMLKEWLIKNNFVQPQYESSLEFIKALSTMKQNSYIAAQKEALALLEWVKRYANAEF